MDCLIIAAGLGSRLVTKGELKPLIPLNGIPLIERVISTYKEANITSFKVIVGYKNEILTPALATLSKKLNVSIEPILNLEWKKANGLSVLKAKDKISETFFLTMSDHIYPSSIIKNFMKVPIKNDQVILAVDYKVKNNPLIDLEDVTRVESQNGLIKNIGKEIPNYNCFDTGIFLCSYGIFSSIEESSKLGNDSLSGGIKIMAKKNKARVHDIKQEYWIDVDSESAFEIAEKNLNLIGVNK